MSAADLAFFLAQPGTTVAWGAIARALAVLWVIAAIGIVYLFERRPLELFLVNADHHAVSFPLMGALGPLALSR